MSSNQHETLHEVTEVAIIRHSERGVLLLHSAARRWHFPDSTVRVGQPWDESLRRSVQETTGINDLGIGPVLLIQKSDRLEVAELPQFGIFFLCSIEMPGPVAQVAHRWIMDPSDLAKMELFHPLVADLVKLGLKDHPSWPRSVPT
jgi:hypothetical protein